MDDHACLKSVFKCRLFRSFILRSAQLSAFVVGYCLCRRACSAIVGNCRVTSGFVGLLHITVSSQFTVNMTVADNDRQPTIQTTTDTCSTPEAERIWRREGSGGVGCVCTLLPKTNV